MKIEITVTTPFANITGEKGFLDESKPYFNGCTVTELNSEDSFCKSYLQTYEASERDIIMLGKKLKSELIITEPSTAGKACGCDVCIEIYNGFRE